MRAHHNKRSDRGASLVEYALLAVFLVLIIWGAAGSVGVGVEGAFDGLTTELRASSGTDVEPVGGGQHGSGVGGGGGQSGGHHSGGGDEEQSDTTTTSSTTTSTTTTTTTVP